MSKGGCQAGEIARVCGVAEGRADESDGIGRAGVGRA